MNRFKYFIRAKAYKKFKHDNLEQHILDCLFYPSALMKIGWKGKKHETV